MRFVASSSRRRLLKHNTTPEDRLRSYLGVLLRCVLTSGREEIPTFFVINLCFSRINATLGLAALCEPTLSWYDREQHEPAAPHNCITMAIFCTRHCRSDQSDALTPYFQPFIVTTCIGKPYNGNTPCPLFLDCFTGWYIIWSTR